MRLWSWKGRPGGSQARLEGRRCVVASIAVFYYSGFSTIVNLGGCLKAFTQATNQPPTAHYEAGGELSNDALPSPQLLDFR